jgi:hypothetical protein
MERARLDRRVNETAQFVLDVLAENGFAPDGSAIRSISKVRLIHAAVRNHLVGRLGDEDVPINQEELLGTLFTFSLVVIRSVRRLGVPMSDAEAEDFFHLWRAVGAMLGIREDSLPATYDEALTLARHIARRQFGPSEDGHALLADLLAGIERHASGIDWLPRYLIRYLVGDEIADHVGVPMDGSLEDKLTLLRLLPRVQASPVTAIVRKLSSLLGRPLLELIIAKKLDLAPADFAIPTDVERR